jgi:hypothetical protein
MPRNGCGHAAVGRRVRDATRPQQEQHRRDHDQHPYGLDPAEQPQGEVKRDHGQIAELGGFYPSFTAVPEALTISMLLPTVS